MKRFVIRAALSAFAVCASTAAMAQDEADARALDLSVPSERIQFASVGGPAERHDPPGAWTPITPAEAEASIANDWEMHGSVEAGIGWSKRGGNSNWQAANLNLGKTYTDDDGETKQIGINIHVGQSDGPAFGPSPFYGPGYYGPAPGPYRARGPMVR